MLLSLAGFFANVFKNVLAKSKYFIKIITFLTNIKAI